MRFLLLLLASLLTLSGCGIIYKVDVQQGNVIEQKQVDQLRPGMTRRQVSLVLGTPAIADPFNQARWDYVFTHSRRGGPAETKRLTVYFEDNLLVRTEGDLAPSGG